MSHRDNSFGAVSFDVIVIGGGMAGVSIAYELAKFQRVALLEMESTLGYHATGRSAATFLETYGPADVRALTRGSRSFLAAPPGCFTTPLITPQPLVQFAARGRAHRITALFDELGSETDAQPMDAHQVYAVCPYVREDAVEAGMYEPEAQRLDVHAIHQGYLAGLRDAGTHIHRSSQVRRLERTSDGWQVHTTESTLSAPIVVNAAGAWADAVAQSAGIAPIGLTPLRRTVFTIDAEGAPAATPMLSDIDETFYVKPEGQQMLCSPADREPHQPGDAKPDELQIARALDQIHAYTTLTARSVRTSWAGLRTFSADGNLVIGPDAQAEGFFWHAGQGGYGIQTAPAAARLGAALIRNEQPPADLVSLGLRPERVSAQRFTGAQTS